MMRSQRATYGVSITHTYPLKTVTDRTRAILRARAAGIGGPPPTAPS
jgi:hypothetical protein